MNYPERFERAINKLVKAFFDGELEKGTCAACAIGNMCGNSSWMYVFVTQRKLSCSLNVRFSQIRHPEHYTGQSKITIDATGYSWQELARVEYAFETAKEVEGMDSLQSQFNGLMAVVEVLCDIEGIEDAEPIKDKFKPKLQEA